MKLLIIQEASRHIENFQYREALCLQRALRRLNDCDAYVWGLGFPTHAVPLDQVIKECDAVLILEQYDEIGWLPNLSQCHKPKIFWSIDPHITYAKHLALCKQQKVDAVLTSVLGYSKRFKKDYSFETSWFPNAYPADLIWHGGLKANRDIPFGYCGSAGNAARKRLLRKLAVAPIGLQPYYDILGDAMVHKLQRFQIAFNLNAADDINYRTFESAAAGCAVLTNYTPGLDYIFDAEKHLIVYRSEKELIEKAEYYTAHPRKRTAIAAAGCEHVKDNHSYDARAASLKNIVEDMI